MRTCHLCNRALRWDENLTLTRVEQTAEPAAPLPADHFGAGVFVVSTATVAAPSEQVHACPKCHAEVNGLPSPEPRYYPKGKRVPQHPQKPDCDLPICGLCRRALPEDDRGHLMRLRGPELSPEDIAAGIQPQDAFHACRECVEKYRPRKLAYLQRVCRECGVMDCMTPGHAPMLAGGASERQVVGGLLT